MTSQGTFVRFTPRVINLLVLNVLYNITIYYLKTVVLVLIVCFCFCANSLMAQTHTARIEKNRNLTASNLIHDLNKSKDTLLLKSDFKISHVYSINSDYKREIDVYTDVNDFKVPLNSLTIGKHVLVVDLTPKKIVFVVYVTNASSLATVKDNSLSLAEN